MPRAVGGMASLPLRSEVNASCFLSEGICTRFGDRSALDSHEQMLPLNGLFKPPAFRSSFHLTGLYKLEKTHGPFTAVHNIYKSR